MTKVTMFTEGKHYIEKHIVFHDSKIYGEGTMVVWRDDSQIYCKEECKLASDETLNGTADIVIDFETNLMQINGRSNIPFHEDHNRLWVHYQCENDVYEGIFNESGYEWTVTGPSKRYEIKVFIKKTMTVGDKAGDEPSPA